MIENYNLYSLGKPLSQNQRDLFILNCKHLTNKTESNNCVIFYRGENKKKMFSHYNSSDFSSFGRVLFLIGNKGKGFLKRMSDQAKKLKKWKIDEVDENIFKDIFIILNNIFSVEHEFLNDDKFVSYFKDKNNNLDFNNKIKGLKKTDRIKLRDYYLTLIHQYEDDVFSPVSTMLSVSHDINKAVRFAGNQEEKIILIGWIPKSRTSNKFIVTFDYLNSIAEDLGKVGLPFWNSSFYPEEKEITLKGGILPHFLIGFIFKDNNENEGIDVNPSLIDKEIKSDLWIKNGLPIDQSGFWNELKGTSHSGAFYVNSNGEYWEELVTKIS